MYYNLFDSHLHSDHSWDAKHSVTFLCETAVKKGVLGISITDHCEINEYESRQIERRIKQCHFEILKARAAFGERLLISNGIELGQMTQDPALTEHVFSLVDFDFVIGSTHCIHGDQDFYFMDFKGADPYALLSDYFDELLAVAKLGRFDTLAHLTYPLRYMNGKYHLGVELSPMDDRIDELFKVLIQSGKALEINTSDLRKDPPVLIPPLKYLKRYRELGGELITFGSDAHCAEAIAGGIPEAMEFAKEAGFRYFAFYKQRVPRMLEIF